MIRLRLNVIPN